nr:DNA polymerase I [Succinivibrionaceae bacterium]
MASQKLALIDGSSYIYRAHYASSRQRLTTAAGIPTGAVVIMANMLRGLIRKHQGDPMLCVFDAHGRNFRHELYPEYKANRPPMPADLITQVGYVHRLVDALGIARTEVAGVEADDVLGSYSRAARAAGMECVIYTGDKDLAQLVGEGVTLCDTMKDVTYDEQAVRERYGVDPCHIVDWLALKGDTSDNIPGMGKVGDVTALALINALGGVEDIYARRDEIAGLKFRGAGKFAARLEEAIESVRLSLRLATINTKVPLPIALPDLRPASPHREELLALYGELEFTRLHDELLRE